MQTVSVTPQFSKHMFTGEKHEKCNLSPNLTRCIIVRQHLFFLAHELISSTLLNSVSSPYLRCGRWALARLGELRTKTETCWEKGGKKISPGTAEEDLCAGEDWQMWWRWSVYTGFTFQMDFRVCDSQHVTVQSRCKTWLIYICILFYDFSLISVNC